MRASTTFSVATPSRNAFEKLRRCVGSIRGQGEVNVEHIIQDAMSSDGTTEWLSAQSDLAAVTEPDDGMYDAINRCWIRSNGSILSWLNSDEQYLPGTLSRVAKFFDETPEADIVYGDAIIADPNGRVIALRRDVPFRSVYVANSFLYVMSCTVFFRRRLLERGELKLDTRYRYAADMDLMLRLSLAGAVVRKIPEYLSVFGVDGSNLSTHQGMRDETEEVRLKYGGFSSRSLRTLVLSARRSERMLAGAYRRQDIDYQFALDERPNYARIVARAVGGRYTLDRPQGKAESVVPLPRES